MKNEVRSFKRPINEDCSVGASLMDVATGRMIPINQDSEVRLTNIGTILLVVWLLYNKHGIEVHTEEEIFEKNIKDLHEVLLNLKVDHTVFRDKAKTELVELQNMINDSMKIKSIQTKKKNDVIQKMTNEIPTLKAKLENELYDVGAPELLKQKIHSQFENELQCSICSKLLCKATVLNCDHTFCEMCIMKRMQKFKSCPVCKAKFKFTSKCITLDNYIIMNQNITGGAKRSAKDVLPSIPPAVEVKKRRRRQ
ncbi:E3 ubiquitin-protein ligase rnf8-B-like [Sipha flava]|uniref:E3 ubiquitin-protein ligase rnf8-B-like n=1 Tax=Sipha flava TaxID=143950 RepID=A0A8B8FY84_9HEMI|nr:E3 ubiquitin-protein ligase rnf8-B-like [Sipha flava]